MALRHRAAAVGLFVVTACAHPGPSGPGSAQPERATAQCLSREAEQRFAAGEWAAAAHLAGQAREAGLASDRLENLHGVALLLQGDTPAALSVWEGSVPMRIATIRTAGAHGADPDALASRAGIRVGMPLTAARFTRALRRLHDRASTADAAIRVDPRSREEVDVTLVVAPREGLQGGTSTLVVQAAGAWVREAVDLTWTGGPAWNAGVELQGRWQTRRRRLAVRVTDALPAASRRVDLYGTLSEETFLLEGSGMQREGLASMEVRTGGWLSPDVFWGASVGRDRWSAGSASRSAWRLGVQAEVRRANDRLRVRMDAERGLATEGAFQTGVLSVEARTSPAATDGWWASALGGVQVASSSTPLLRWPGAGTGQARAALLRAHPLLVDGALDLRGAFGRSMVHASVEVQSPPARLGPLELRLATHADLARVGNRAHGLRPFAAWDAGLGLRARTFAGWTARTDLSWGLLDGERAASVGLVHAWDPWR